MDRTQDEKFIKWAKLIKERDDYVCQTCFKRGGYLNAHHMNSWDIHIDQRYDKDNGVTLCKKCHDALHMIYGVGNNTKEQFEEFKAMTGLINKVARNIEVESRKKRG